MFQIFQKGGPIMWPLLCTSLVALTVVFERLLFLLRERSHRQPEVVESVLGSVERNEVTAAIQNGKRSQDFVARTLIYALEHRENLLSPALLRAASRELKRFNRAGVKASPNYLKNPEPAYPPTARRRHQEGLVVLSVKVSAQGRSIHAEIKQGSGLPLPDDAALQAVSGWEFAPARIGLVAIESEIEVPIRFKLAN